jgi:drug/metabolite transporter (DMT)-like permease
MSTIFIVILFGLLAAIAWGISDFLIGKSSKSLGPIKGALLVNIAGALVYSLAFIVFLHRNATFTTEGILYVLAAGVFFGLAQATFFKAMYLGPVGLVSSISSVYPLITLLISVVFFAAQLSLQQTMGVVLVVAGVVMASGIANSKIATTRVGKGPILALIPILGWGVGWVLVAQAVSKMSWESVLLIELCMTMVTLIVLTPLVKGKERISIRDMRTGWSMSVVWGAAIIQTLGILAVYLGIDQVPDGAAIVVALSACYPLLTIFLALRHLGEKIALIPLLGGFLGVAGIVILSLG